MTTISTSTSISPSSRIGIGAIPYEGGSAFRVWAPFASEVLVKFYSIDGSDKIIPLAKDSDNKGYWSTDVPSIQVGDEYKYLIHNGSKSLEKNDPYAKHVTSSGGNSVVLDSTYDWKPTKFQMPVWNELVIYEMHVGTFNDDIDPGLGTFRSIKAKLDVLFNLGINAIQIMPAEEFPGDKSWGYNPVNPFAIESAFGTFKDLKEFVEEAHTYGIAVILDVVYNHFGPNPDLDLWQFDGWSENNKGGIYFYNDWRSWTPWGDTRPDYGRGEIRQYIHNNALMWLEECRVDGLRFDATLAYISNAYGKNSGPGGEDDIPDGWTLMQWINKTINERQPWKITIAEDLRNNESITKDTGVGGAGFDSQWDTGEFLVPIRNAITAPDDNFRNMYAVRNAIYHRFNTNAFERVVFTECHDEVANGKSRVPEEIWPGNAGSWYSKKRSTIGAALVFTSPGIPMIFQGQEILEDESFRDDNPIDWSKLDKYRGIYNMYRDLIRLRRNWYNNTRGLRGQHVNVHHINNNDKLIAFHRWENGGLGDDVIVVVNMANRSYNSYNIGFPREGTWYVRFNSDWEGYIPSKFGNQLSYDTTAGRANWGDTDGMAYSGNVGIGPYSAIILSQ